MRSSADPHCSQSVTVNQCDERSWGVAIHFQRSQHSLLSETAERPDSERVRCELITNRSRRMQPLRFLHSIATRIDRSRSVTADIARAHPLAGSDLLRPMRWNECRFHSNYEHTELHRTRCELAVDLIRRVESTDNHPNLETAPLAVPSVWRAVERDQTVNRCDE